MQRNILTGSEFLLYNIDNEPIAYCTNSAIKINNSLTDVTTKDSDSWSESLVGIKDWSIEFEGLISYGDDFNTTYFLNMFQNAEPFFIRFGVIQDNFTHAFYGEVHIESIDQSSNDGEIVSYSGSLKGIGNLVFTDEGTPEQSGYLKVESDPVFRGSAAYGISEADKVKWNAANSKIVKEINSFVVGDVTTLKLKFNDGIEFSTSFMVPPPVIDLSGYYTKNQTDARLAATQVDIDNANTLLSNIANDNKLTPSEKINVLKEWQIIQDEKPVMVQQAVDNELETINYDVAFNELELYLEPFLLSMITTSNIEGFELRDNFRAYYDQKLLLIKAINEAQKLYSDQKLLDTKTELTDYVDVSILDKANEIITNTTNEINVANSATLLAAKNESQLLADAARDAAIISASGYTLEQKALAEATAAAYADGILDAEEQARLTQAANNLQAAKDDSTSKANAAAEYGIAAQNLHNALVGNLKALAYEDKIEAIKLGGTILSEGGYLKADLFDVTWLQANVATIEYLEALNIVAKKLAANEGTIGPLNIESESLYLGNENFWEPNSNFVKIAPYITINQVNGATNPEMRKVSFNQNFAPYPEDVAAYTIISSFNNTTNYALIVDAKNATNNIGISVRNGNVNIENGNLYVKGSITTRDTSNNLKTGITSVINYKRAVGGLATPVDAHFTVVNGLIVERGDGMA